MKGLVFSYIGLSTHAIHKLAKLPLACGQRALWQAQWMGVVRLTQCQAHSAARLYGSTQAWKNDTFFFFFHKPHLFYIRHSQQPQRRHFLASRKPAWTINRMCLTCSPMFFFSVAYSFLFWIFNTTFVWRLQKYPSFEPCFLFLWEIYRPACIALCNADSPNEDQDEFVTLKNFFFDMLSSTFQNSFLGLKQFNQSCILTSKNWCATLDIWGQWQQNRSENLTWGQLKHLAWVQPF